MSKILVVEPRRMLQQAIAMSVFPDHEVQTIQSLPEEISTLKDFDLVILDVDSLRAKNAFGAEASRWVQTWTVPVLWVDSEEATDVPKREKWVMIKGTLTREKLLSGVAQCLGLPSVAQPSAAIGVDAGAGATTTAGRGRKTAGSAAQAPAALIELVDVVEEEAEDKTNKKEFNKKQS